MIITLEDATTLRVVNMFQPNETGWQTPRVLYDRAVIIPGYGPVAPYLSAYQNWVDHGTVGTNTLAFWCTGGSIANSQYSLAQYLIPRDQTEYKDGRLHDTRNVVFKMVPDGYACNHVGVAIHPFYNHNTKGVEYESLQNGTHDITDQQYKKGALVFAYDSDLEDRWHRIRDEFRVPHGLVAVPWGRRTDPWAGQFDICRSNAIVYAIRQNQDIQKYWGR